MRFVLSYGGPQGNPTQPMKTVRIQVETYDGCRTIWYEKSRLKEPTKTISERVMDQLSGLNIKRVEVSLSPATV